MSFVFDIFRFFYYLAAALVDVVLGRKRKIYETVVDIVGASPEDVWKIVSARELTFEGPVPVVIKVAPRPGAAGVLEGAITVGDLVLPLVYRELEERPGEAAMIEILRDGTHPKMVPGDDYYVAYALAPIDGGTRMTLRHELTHTDFMGRVGIPLGAVQSARRIKRHALGPASASLYGIDNRVVGAVMTGVLTFASFYYLFGGRLAAILLALIFVHEAGHAIAMRWVGLPVQGIYFIPFLGGVAVSGAPHRSEAERGFVALMGPGLSIASTAVFFAVWKITEQPVYAELALVSAFLNGINLAPILPLDGGHVTASLLSRSDPEFGALMNFTGLIAGVAVAVYFEWHILLALLALNAVFAFRTSTPATNRLAISQAGMAWLATGYFASIAFYAAIVFELTR